jgi:hypothetical protein
MKNKRFTFCIVLLLGLALLELKAQNMNVIEADQTHTYSLNNIRSLTFSSGNLIIKKTDNNSTSFALNLINNVNFDFIISNESEIRYAKNTIPFVYPNPVKDILNINIGNLNESVMIRILSLEGKIIVFKKVNSSENIAIDLSELSSGVYLCQYITDSETRTIKIIKE